MFYFYLKIFLAILLTVIPFIYALFIRPIQLESQVWRNSLTALAHYMPKVIWWCKKRIFSLSKVIEKMRYSINLRKRFLAVVLVALCLVQSLDCKASVDAFNILTGNSEITPDECFSEDFFEAFLSTKKASAIAIAFCLTFIFYRPADTLLNFLHSNIKLTLFVMLFAAFLPLVFAHSFVLTQTLVIVCFAAIFYPPMTPK